MRKKIISIVVPTFREAKNIPVLCEKIAHIFKKLPYAYEIIIVDDNSQDGTDKAVTALKKKKINVTLKVRTEERGLSSAVIAGFDMAKGDILFCMDADLSHPVEAIPGMIAKIADDGAEFVIGSRNVPGGSADTFSAYRKLNAWGAKTLARPFAKVTDPMAGFFCFTKTIYTPKVRKSLNPIGWKIGLELLVKSNPKKIMEVPITFQDRLYGESKLSAKEQLNYIKHLARLFEFKYRTLSEFIKFCFVGATGAVIDLTFVYLSYRSLRHADLFSRDVCYGVSRVVGFAFAVTSNFFLNRAITFAKVTHRHLLKQYFSFVATCIFGFAVNWSVSMGLFQFVHFFNHYYLLSALVGIFCGTLINFTGSKFVTFRIIK
ncbi:MAG: glycosyltransferase [Spirochaetota bacterium]